MDHERRVISADEVPEPNPIPDVDTRYTGTPDDAIDAEYENEEERGDVIDLQPANAPRIGRGAGARHGGTQKKKKPLYKNCACNFLNTADVSVCQGCGADLKRRSNAGRKIDGRNARGYKTHPSAETIEVFKRIGNPGHYLDAMAVIAHLVSAPDMKSHFFALMELSNVRGLSISEITAMLESWTDGKKGVDNHAT